MENGITVSSPEKSKLNPMPNHHGHPSATINHYYMNILHFLTSSSDLNIAIPLRSPFHDLSIVQVGFAGARSFVHHLVSEFLMK